MSKCTINLYVTLIQVMQTQMIGEQQLDMLFTSIVGHCQSSTESEYVGMFHAVCEIPSLRNMMEEMGYAQHSPTIIHEDNEGSIKIAKNPRCHDRLKHIDLKYHLTRDAVENGKIVIRKIGTSDQIADILTKSLSKHEHWKHANQLLK